MPAAPPSCAAGTNRAPPATSAFVAWKLPLPTTPNTCRTPCPASVRPTASATRIAVLPLDEREHAARAAGSTQNRQRTGDEHRPGRRQGGDVTQLGEAVLAVAE